MAATLLLDTCAWLDAFAAPEALKPSVRKLLGRESWIHVSAVSLLEVARKEAKGELVFGMALSKWFQLAFSKVCGFAVLILTVHIDRRCDRGLDLPLFTMWGETPNAVSLVPKNQKIEPQMNRMYADGQR